MAGFQKKEKEVCILQKIKDKRLHFLLKTIGDFFKKKYVHFWVQTIKQEYQLYFAYWELKRWQRIELLLFTLKSNSTLYNFFIIVSLKMLLLLQNSFGREYIKVKANSARFNKFLLADKWVIVMHTEYVIMKQINVLLGLLMCRNWVELDFVRLLWNDLKVWKILGTWKF